jgi:membrane protease YdiL (CAAX protease family)
MFNIVYILTFSIKSHLLAVVRLKLPFLMLVWALAERENYFNRRQDGRRKMTVNAVLVILLASVALFIIALVFSSLASLAGEGAAASFVERPENVAEFAAMLIACLSTAYLEESFFRFYLLEKLNALGRSTVYAVAVSALAFAALHLWEGRWGVLNAAAAALLLSFAYLKTRKLHIAALAHFLYNAAVYMLA